MRVIIALIVVVVSSFALATDRSEYVGDELGQIKSLSVSEVESLRRGSGMGFAKLAELNHFPGPKHVLEMADQLGLTPSQTEASRLLYQEMHNNAVALGEALLTAESALDQAFAKRLVTAPSLEESLIQIGSIRAQLRYAHLEAHLRQAQILTAHQIGEYDAIRGYQTNEHDETRH